MKISPFFRSIPASLMLVAAAAALWVWRAPAELTLGNGIKIVYLHVAAAWAGLTGLLIAGALGAVILITGQRAAIRLTRSIGWSGLAFFGAGLALSMAAAQINWGGVALSEPRMAASLQIAALALIVQILAGWPIPARLKGGLWAVLAVIVSVVRTPLELHPQNPIGTATSPAIQLTFFGLYVLFLMGAVQVVRMLYSPAGR